MSERRQILVPTIVVLAGRRIDLPGANPPSFPLERVREVSRLIAQAFEQGGARMLICSAACGADLVALEQAERLGLRRRIVLPFSADQFLLTSVVDRPGDWKPVYEHQISTAKASGDLVELDLAVDDDAAYKVTNIAIVREAQALAESSDHPNRVICMLVWEGVERPGGDATVHLGSIANQAGFKVESIPTS